MNVRVVTPREAKALMEDGWRYLDVRSAPEFEEGRPRGAINVPWQHMTASGLVQNARFVEDVAAALPSTTRIVVGCKSGNRATHAATALALAGFDEVVVCRAGWDGVRDHFGSVREPGWSRLELPVDRE